MNGSVNARRHGRPREHNAFYFTPTHALSHLPSSSAHSSVRWRPYAWSLEQHADASSTLTRPSRSCRALIACHCRCLSRSTLCSYESHVIEGLVSGLLHPSSTKYNAAIDFFFFLFLHYAPPYTQARRPQRNDLLTTGYQFPMLLPLSNCVRMS